MKCSLCHELVHQILVPSRPYITAKCLWVMEIYNLVGWDFRQAFVCRLGRLL